eukprot:242437-Rhodomonas_salina.1
MAAYAMPVPGTAQRSRSTIARYAISVPHIGGQVVNQHLRPPYQYRALHSGRVGRWEAFSTSSWSPV